MYCTLPKKISSESSDLENFLCGWWWELCEAERKYKISGGVVCTLWSESSKVQGSGSVSGKNFSAGRKMGWLKEEVGT